MQVKRLSSSQGLQLSSPLQTRRVIVHLAPLVPTENHAPPVGFGDGEVCLVEYSKAGIHQG